MEKILYIGVGLVAIIMFMLYQQEDYRLPRGSARLVQITGVTLLISLLIVFFMISVGKLAKMTLLIPGALLFLWLIVFGFTATYEGRLKKWLTPLTLGLFLGLSLIFVATVFGPGAENQTNQVAKQEVSLELGKPNLPTTRIESTQQPEISTSLTTETNQSQPTVKEESSPELAQSAVAKPAEPEPPTDEPEPATTKTTVPESKPTGKYELELVLVPTKGQSASGGLMYNYKVRKNTYNYTIEPGDPWFETAYQAGDKRLTFVADLDEKANILELKELVKAETLTESVTDTIKEKSEEFDVKDKWEKIKDGGKNLFNNFGNWLDGQEDKFWDRYNDKQQE